MKRGRIYFLRLKTGRTYFRRLTVEAVTLLRAPKISPSPPKISPSPFLVATIVGAVAGSGVAQWPVADAAMRGDGAEVRRLVQSGADVKAAQADGGTALHWAAYHGDVALAEVLLKAGADVATPNRNGSTPMWLAASQGDSKMVVALLNNGAKIGRASCRERAWVSGRAVCGIEKRRGE